MIDALEKSLDAFASADPRVNPPWLKSIREAARARARQTGFPNTRQEEWRFTNVAPLLELPLHAAAQNGRQVSARDIEPFRFAPDWPCLVFVDGCFRGDLSSLPPRESGVEADSLRTRLNGNAAELQNDLARHASYDANFFTALNTAFFQDGAYVSAADDAKPEHPVHLLFVAASDKPGATAQTRNLILAGRCSELKVVETYASLTAAPHVTNAVTELVLGPGARLEHCRLQNQNQASFHVATVQAVQEKDSHLLSHSIATGARVARNQIQTLLNAPGAVAVLNGLYLGRDDQLIDHHTVVDHAMPNCESHEFYNGVLADRAHGVFNGKIFVRRDAQKTNAKQTNRNLVLSENAIIDTKPQLEIFADDVKCTHGATVGQLDHEALFYLRSRGISAAGARQMLIRAFAGGVVERITMQPVRERLDQLLAGRFDHAQA
ncbi:MAG TPA: Fe-S cluster assembly protein SufD [Candidatus Baltobacteraceae bacterium]|jgi:Fe-S cluster assembly protein SufD|nr:Fe-S cluster assembly protein SufD [Candidatus Baltobacteraceae bacterium]